MEDNRQSRKKRKTIIALITIFSIAMVLFLCIFSLYHLPERDPVETPEMTFDSNPVEAPVTDFAETNDIMTASQQQVSEMLGELEMQYENAKLNNEPYAAQQAGLRLATAYWKAGETSQSKDLINSLIQNYSYDTSFVSKAQDLLKTLSSQP